MKMNECGWGMLGEREKCEIINENEIEMRDTWPHHADKFLAICMRICVIYFRALDSQYLLLCSVLSRSPPQRFVSFQ